MSRKDQKTNGVEEVKEQLTKCLFDEKVFIEPCAMHLAKKWNTFTAIPLPIGGTLKQPIFVGRDKDANFWSEHF